MVWKNILLKPKFQVVCWMSDIGYRGNMETIPGRCFPWSVGTACLELWDGNRTLWEIDMEYTVYTGRTKFSGNQWFDLKKKVGLNLSLIRETLDLSD